MYDSWGNKILYSVFCDTDCKTSEAVIQQLKEAMMEMEDTMQSQDTLINTRDEELTQMSDGRLFTSYVIPIDWVIQGFKISWKVVLNNSGEIIEK